MPLSSRLFVEWLLLLVGLASSLRCHQAPATAAHQTAHPATRSAFRPVLALSASRTQNLVAEVLAAVFEDLLDLPVEFADTSAQRGGSFREGAEYDVDVESHIPAEQGGLLDPDFVDLGDIGYHLQGGLYVWPASLAAKGGVGPYYDWYGAHAELQNASRAFPALPIPRPSDGCAERGNGSRRVDEAQPRCGQLSRFVPPHCEGPDTGCAEVYAASPELSLGHLEALIVEHRLPYVAVYVGRREHGTLPRFGLPFVSYGVLPGDDPAVYSPSTQVLFPDAACGVSQGRGRGGANCGESLTFPRKVASRRFRERWPAAFLVLSRLRLTQEQLADLLELDRQDVRPVGGGACAFFTSRLQEFRSLVGLCRASDQAVSASTGACVCPPGRLQLANGSCGDCPAHSFCPGLGAVPGARPCGFPNATASAANGSQGPASRAACVCSPGFEPSGDLCAPCPAGFYKKDAANTTCSDSCPPFSVSAEGSSRELDCRCVAGHFLARASPLVCTACEGLQGGEGASCHARSPSPLAKPGWYALCQGSPFEAAGLRVAFQRCSVPSSCLGGGCAARSRCAEGSEGVLCGACSLGFSRHTAGAPCRQCDSYAVALLVVAATFASTMAFACYCAARSTKSTAHGNALPAIGVIVWHHCCVVAARGDARWWLPQPIWASGRFALTCLLQAHGLRAAHRQAAVLVLLPLVWPLLALLLCFGLVRAISRLRRPGLPRVKARVDDAVDVLAALEGLDSLDDDRASLAEHFRRDVRRHVDHLAFRSSILGIWSCVRLPEDRPRLSSAVRRFLFDSSDVVLCIESLLCPALLPVLLAAVAPLQLPQPGAGWVLHSEPREQYWSDSHLPSFALCAAALLLYGVGLPTACYLALRADARDPSPGRRGLCASFRHGVDSEFPRCCWQVILIVQRSLVSIVQEGYLPQRDASVLYLVAAIASIVAHALLEPFSKAQASALNALQRQSFTCWVSLALLYCLDLPDDAQVISPLILLVFLLQVRFWCCVALEVCGELRRKVHVKVTRAHAFLLQTGRHEERTRWLWRACAEELHGGLRETGASRLQRSAVQVCTWLADAEVARQKREPKLTITNRSRNKRKGAGWSTVVKEVVIFADAGGQARSGRWAAALAATRSSAYSHFLGPVASAGSLLLGLDKAKRASRSKAGESGSAAPVISRSTRRSFASVLERAMRALLLIHHFDCLPTCIIEFLICDAICFKFEGQKAERRRRAEVVAHLSRRCREDGEQGVLAAMEDDETRLQSAPHSRAAQIWHIAQQFAGKRGTGHSLTVDDLEYYVQHLQRESSALVRDTVAEFAAKVAEATAQMLAASRTSDAAAQTLLFEDEAVQTDGKASVGTSTDLFLTQVAWGHGGRADELQRWQRELQALCEEESDLRTLADALEEELVAALHEEEALRSQLAGASPAEYN